MANAEYYLTPYDKSVAAEHYEDVYANEYQNQKHETMFGGPGHVQLSSNINTSAADRKPATSLRSAPRVLRHFGVVMLIFFLIVLGSFISSYLLYAFKLKETIDKLRPHQTIKEVYYTRFINQTYTCSCPAGWFWSGTTCYLIGREVVTFEGMSVFCRNRSSTVACPPTRAANKFLKAAIRAGTVEKLKSVWTGFTLHESGDWVCDTDHSILTYSDWGPTEPNGEFQNITEDCAVFYNFFNYKWGDYPCNSLFYPLCEKQCTKRLIS